MFLIFFNFLGIEEELPRKEEEKRVDWPVFGDGFMLYISVGLILLTIINNILFKLFLGPPVPRPPPFQRTEQPSSEGAQRMRYRVRSFKDPLYLERRAPSFCTNFVILSTHATQHRMMWACPLFLLNAFFQSPKFSNHYVPKEKKRSLTEYCVSKELSPASPFFHSLFEVKMPNWGLL
jgi:hypothetical protein